MARKSPPAHLAPLHLLLVRGRTIAKAHAHATYNNFALLVSRRTQQRGRPRRARRPLLGGAEDSPRASLDGPLTAFAGVAAFAGIARQDAGKAASRSVRRLHGDRQLIAVERTIDDFSGLLLAAAILSPNPQV